MKLIYAVGMGPGPAAEVPARNLRLLKGQTPRGRAPVILRTSSHPLAAWLTRRGARWESCDARYEGAADFESLYRDLVALLLARVEETGVLVYGVPGHPLLGERTVTMLLEQAPSRGVEVRVVGAPSFLEAAFTALGLDPLVEGFEVVDAQLPPGWMPRGDKPLLVCQLWHPLLLGDLKLRLLDLYPPDHRVALVKGVRERETVTWLPLVELDRGPHTGPTTSLWVPALPAPGLPTSLAQKVVRAVEVVARLRGQGGCPWDRRQTHLSLRPYVIEEAYEVAEAIRQASGAAGRAADEAVGGAAGRSPGGDKLAEELGDLLLQVLLHAQIGREEGTFDLGTVCDLLVEKLVRRHPHVFGETRADTAQEVLRRWNAIKREERGEDSSALDGVPAVLPALQRAWRVQGRAREVGFDWEPGDVEGVLAKVAEELDEVRAAARGPGAEEAPAATRGAREEEASAAAMRDRAVEWELGDLLFAVVNACRVLGVDPEVALQGTVDRFSRRFRAMEKMARQAGKNVGDLSLEEMDSLWESVKRKEK
ncbi:MAG: nucleoside triphosphate pyrophosphohydrolase [Bacillota bacterium]|nr:nucleoside triphosphate pyrophosphohydrolase [Bacillota bacterium]